MTTAPTVPTAAKAVPTAVIQSAVVLPAGRTAEEREHVSLEQLAQQLGVEKKEADGWNRNLGRSIKAIVREYNFLRPDQEDGTAQLFDLQWRQDEEVWAYAVPKRFRQALLTALNVE